MDAISSSLEETLQMTKGKIIFLNGTSSSGKTSIAKALQQILDEPYLHFSVDSFVMMLPEQYIFGKKRWLLGELIHPVVSGVHRCIAASASAGNNIIVDHVLQFPQWLKECVNVLADFPVLFVGVRCPLEELERREQQRNRERGLARGQFDQVHVHGIYDVEVDTSICDTMECALRIKEVLKDIHSSRAFSQLREVLASETA